jgi:hypothetical protein
LFEELTYGNSKEIAQIVAEGEVPSKYDKTLSIRMVDHTDLEEERNWIRILRKDDVIEDLISVAEDMLRVGKEVWD